MGGVKGPKGQKGPKGHQVLRGNLDVRGATSGMSRRGLLPAGVENPWKMVELKDFCTSVRGA